MLRIYRNAAVIALIIASGQLVSQQPQPRTTYDPGIRPVTEESIRVEQADEDAWAAHLNFLASNKLGGRQTGTPDFLRAVEYVESQFKSMGLKPSGTDGYRQAVGFHTISTDVDHSQLLLLKPDRKQQALKLGEEATLSPQVDSSEPIEASAVFVGYGFAVPSQQYDDLKGVDLRGKITVVFAGSPLTVHGPLKAYFRSLTERWQQLKAAGAVGVITIPEPRQLQGGPSRAPQGSHPLVLLSDPEMNPLQGLRLNATVPITAAQALFEGTSHTLDELLKTSAEGKNLPRFPLALKISAVTSIHETDRFSAPNVVACLEGSDPTLKSEYLVISAHLDHLGIGRPIDGDNIYNGAMDNAAGVASLIEVAKALASGQRPKRSILFLALTGEEEGELGSQFFARYPTVPRSHIIADLNMDMYLPLFPLHFLEVQGLGESTLGNDVRAAAQRNDIEVQFDKQPNENRFIRSDQASFVKYGIPGLAFKFGWLPDSPEQKIFNEWIRDRYHRPSDDLDQPIDRAAAVHFDRVLVSLTRRVASAETRPSWYPESFFSTLPRR